MVLIINAITKLAEDSCDAVAKILRWQIISSKLCY